MTDKAFYFDDPEKYLHKSFGTRIRAEIVRGLLGDIANKKIIDLGCGDGSITMQFVRANKVTFVDMSANMLQLTISSSEAYKTNCEYINSSILDLPFKNEFDIAVAIGILAHIDDTDAAIKKVKSYINSNGLIVLQFSDNANLLTRLNILLAKRHYNHKISTLDRGQLKKILERNDLQIVKQIKYAFMLPGMGKMSDSFLYKLQKATLKLPIFKLIYTDHIWLVKPKCS